MAGLFEDQAGKFDWRQSYVGKVRQLDFPTTSVTESNVVAGLDTDSEQSYGDMFLKAMSLERFEGDWSVLCQC